MAHFGIDFDVTGRLLYETVNHRKAKARASFWALGGKEGLEDLFKVFWRYACTRVGDGDFHIIANGDIFVLGAIGLIQMAVCRFDDEVAALWFHRVPGIDGQIKDGGFEHGSISLDGPEIFVWNDLELNRGADCMLQHVRHFEDEVIHREFLVLQSLLA